MSKDILISVRNIMVSYKCQQSLFSSEYYDAIKNVSFDLCQGDSLGIVGRNGAGKTTLLRILGGIILPDSGILKMAEGISTTLLALQIGFDQELTGRENVLVSGMLLGFSKKYILGNMDRIISFAELGEFIDKPTRTYSAGMKARLGFAIALEMTPDVLLIDEVLGVGDAQFQRKSVAMMKKKLLSDQTIVFVSHNANLVKELCNKAVWIENGITQMSGEVGDVVTAYQQYLNSPSHE